MTKKSRGRVLVPSWRFLVPITFAARPRRHFPTESLSNERSYWGNLCQCTNQL